MAIISTFAGSGLARRLADSSGTSRWQCGHQCATPSSTLALPLPGSIFTASPLNDCPLMVGTAVPTAESELPPSNLGNGSPVTVTGRFAALRWLVDALEDAPVDALVLALLPPPPPQAPATTAASTAATPTMTLRLGRDTGGLLRALYGCGSTPGRAPCSRQSPGNRSRP